MTHRKSVTCNARRLLATLLFSILLFSCDALAQNAGIVRGTINDSNGASVTGATVIISGANGGSSSSSSSGSSGGGFSRRTTTDEQGRFQFINVPFNRYTLSATQEGFGTAQTAIELRSNVPVDETLTLDVSSVTEQVTVTAQEDRALAASTSTRINQTTLDKLTGSQPSRQLENVILSAPGIVKDENGRFHPRGSHYQASFVIDGVPVSDQLSAVFSNNFDARNASALQVDTGNIAPEFGNKVGAVIQVTTESGFDAGRNYFGELSAGGGSFNTGEGSFKFGGKTGNNKFGYFFSGATGFSSRFLDPPFQNATADFGSNLIVTANDKGLHNYGNDQRFFTRFDYVADERNLFNFKIVAGRTRLDIPNLPSQQLSGQAQTQRNRDLSFYPQFQHIFNASTTFTVAPYFRLSTSNLEGSAGDTPIRFDVQRRLVNAGVTASVAYVGKGHSVKAGIDAFRFPSREGFNFQITSPTFNALPENFTANINADGTINYAFDPSLSEQAVNEILENFNPNLVAYDATALTQAAANGSVINGTPRPFMTNPQRTGREFSTYVQDTYTFKNLTVSGGARFDAYKFLVNNKAVSPRVGVAYAVPQTGTVWRASYNRVLQTPSTEYLLISETGAALTLVNPRTQNLFGRDIRLIQSERGNWFEAGAQQTIRRIGRIDAVYYRKRIKDLHDNDQFLNTSVIFPVSLTRGRIDGFDARFESNRYKGFGGYLSLGTVRAIVRPPFSGGLFLGGEPVETFNASEFRIDHDQKLNVQTAVQYDNRRRGLFAQLLARYDSGLVTEIENIEEATANPDLASGLRFIDFDGDPTRVRPRAVFDASLGYDFLRREGSRLGVQVDVLNLTDKQGLYNFLSVFSGTHYIAPRSFSGRLTYNF